MLVLQFENLKIFQKNVQRWHSGSHAIAWAAIVTSVHSGFLRTFKLRVTLQFHAFVVYIQENMGAFDFLFGKKDTAANKHSEATIEPFVFKSNSHQRYQNGNPAMGLQHCIRTVCVEKNTHGCSGYKLAPGVGYIIKIYNDDLGKPNMSDKPMKIVSVEEGKVELRGFMVEAQSPFGWQEVDYSVYGFTIYYCEGIVSKCVLHMYDRNIHLEYYKKEDEIKNAFSSNIENEKTNNSIIEDIAIAVNWNFNTNNQTTCLEAMVELYQAVQKESGRILLDLPASNCQSVGLAFTCMALFFDNGDKDINSVAAENAYYCLAKSYIEKNNTYSLPAIFSMLQRKPNLLNEKFIASWCSMAEKQVGMSIGLMLGGNPFRDPHLQDFRNQATGFMSQVKYYLLNIFYDIEHRKFMISTDIPYFLPTEQEITSFLLSIEDGKNDTSDYLSIGESHFDSVFKECEDTLSRF